MIKRENQCVNCGLPCLGSSCPYVNVPIYYCDNCGNDNGKYEIEGEELCECCTKEMLQEVFDELSIKEKSEILNIKCKSIE